MTAEAALARLRVARQTLYAYVSRGLVRVRASRSATRAAACTIRAASMRCSSAASRGRARQAVAASTIDFGEPVLASRITRIANGALLYRGQDAIELAHTATLEEVAALLWEAPEFPPLQALGLRPRRTTIADRALHAPGGQPDRLGHLGAQPHRPARRRGGAAAAHRRGRLQRPSRRPGAPVDGTRLGR